MAGADGQMENQIICDRVSYRKVDSGVNVVVYDLMERRRSRISLELMFLTGAGS